jgi:prophage regulatory protein
MRIMRFREVREKTGLSRSTVWRLERSGAFPRRHQLSPGAVGWFDEDVEEWLRKRSAL